ncbi:hypothetical protein ACVWWO_000320 [Bradyrhizobium sp. F1.13.1]
MSRCTAPVRGHRTASAAAECPACGGRSRSYGGGFRSYPTFTSSYSSPSYSSSSSSGGGRSSGGGSGSRVRARWSRPGSSVMYTPTEVRELTPVREAVEKQASLDLRDVFLCHAWDDRQGSAKELHDLLEARGVKVWFSQKDVGLGVPFAPHHRQGPGELADWDRIGDPCLAATPPKREHRRQGAFCAACRCASRSRCPPDDV